ncbi:hypothetical protein HDU76_011730 [Blyttiomyces sp. JEL0837]|nr:hypothetical protein HDU76_011730 [Blyttiomyces sp. JEL0837]
MQLIIALRFIQEWWKKPELKKFLPEWVTDLEIPKPRGVLDCRGRQSADNRFLQQLRDPQFPWILLPPVNAGPDLRFSVFSCYVKTTSTASSQSTMYVAAKECNANMETMNRNNWYKSQPSVKSDCLAEAKKQRFVQMRFELPDTAPSKKPKLETYADGEDYVIYVNLQSDFAKVFFKEKFVNAYNEFVKNVKANQPKPMVKK